MALAPASTPEGFRDEQTSAERVDVMTEWFLENFEDPSHDLPYDKEKGGYIWLWGGPYDARDELEEAFPDATPQELKQALLELEQNGVQEWAPNTHRVEDDSDVIYDLGIQDYDGTERRPLPEDDPHKFTLVETTLLPQRNFSWSIHATFIPVQTNQSLSEVINFAIGSDDSVRGYGRDDYTFETLRDLVGVLVSVPLAGSLVGSLPDTEEAYEWIRSLKSDDEVFVDDGIIVHASPPEWLPLSSMFKHGSASAVALISNSPGHWTGVVLMYGGSLIFLRLVKNINFVQDAFFERWAKRIKKGDNDPR